ncbi:MAG: hypothetical protein LUC39_00870 [Clostridiales bacterium]|nr:hypothetical protein [Clostridiales bacterium]
MAQTANMLEQLDKVGLQETLSQTLQNVKERRDIFALICSPNFESDGMIDSLDMLLKKNNR